VTNTGVGKGEKKALRLYIRLTLSYGDFKHAYRASQYLSAQHEVFAREGGDDLLLRALYSSLVVSYARPFNSTGASRYGRIPALCRELHAEFTGDDLEVHEYILYCRNKLIAHTDAEVADPDVYVATDLPRNFVVPERNDALAPFSADFTAKVLRLTEKAYHWSVTERHRLEPEILHLLERKTWAKDEGHSNDGA
jgi:hypothetical protein